MMWMDDFVCVCLFGWFCLCLGGFEIVDYD